MKYIMKSKSSGAIFVSRASFLCELIQSSSSEYSSLFYVDDPGIMVKNGMKMADGPLFVSYTKNRS